MSDATGFLLTPVRDGDEGNRIRCATLADAEHRTSLLLWPKYSRDVQLARHSAEMETSHRPLLYHHDRETAAHVVEVTYKGRMVGTYTRDDLPDAINAEPETFLIRRMEAEVAAIDALPPKPRGKNKQAVYDLLKAALDNAWSEGRTDYVPETEPAATLLTALRPYLK